MNKPTAPTATVQQIIQQYQHTHSNSHVQHVMTQLAACRTAKLGYHTYQCSDDECAQIKYQYHSCRNRHCPQCGAFQKQQWIEDRKRELLPIAYYHVVFTLPHELNSIILGNRKQLFALLFEASAKTIQCFAKDKKYLNAQPGFLSVLHTWGQQFSFHLENADRVAVYFLKKNSTDTVSVHMCIALSVVVASIRNKVN